MDLSPSLLYKCFKFRNKKCFLKGGRRFLRLKKMGGDEGTILKHKVKAKENNRLTNKKSTLDIRSQCRILILWIETKKEKILKLSIKPSFKGNKSSQKLGRVTVVYR